MGSLEIFPCKNRNIGQLFCIKLTVMLQIFSERVRFLWRDLLIKNHNCEHHPFGGIARLSVSLAFGIS